MKSSESIIYHGSSQIYHDENLVRHCRYEFMKSHKRRYTKNKQEGFVLVWRNKLGKDEEANESYSISRKTIIKVYHITIQVWRKKITKGGDESITSVTCNSHTS